MKGAKAAIKSTTSTNDNNNNGKATTNNEDDDEEEKEEKEKKEEEEEGPIIHTSKGKRKVTAAHISRRSKRVKPIVTPTTPIRDICVRVQDIDKSRLKLPYPVRRSAV